MDGYCCVYSLLDKDSYLIFFFSSLPISKYKGTNYLDNKVQLNQCWKRRRQSNDNPDLPEKVPVYPNEYKELPQENGKVNSIRKSVGPSTNVDCVLYHVDDKKDCEVGRDNQNSRNSVSNSSAVFDNPVIKEGSELPGVPDMPKSKAPLRSSFPVVKPHSPNHEQSRHSSPDPLKQPYNITNQGFDKKRYCTPASPTTCIDGVTRGENQD